MFFSKSFGYAVRSIMYIALVQQELRCVQTEEIALNLGVPRHFVGKILKKLAKADILLSVKGPNGGFQLNSHALQTTLLDLYLITSGPLPFHQCALRVRECNAQNPCPMHVQMNHLKAKMQAILVVTSISMLLSENKSEIIRSICSEELL